MVTKKKLLTAAAGYRSKGLWVIPLRAKVPQFKAWQKHHLELDELSHRMQADADGIGLLTGTSHGNLLDVDLDHPLAIELAPEFLPGTGLIAGRPGAPRSHWFYTCDEEPAYISRKLSKDKTIVELRGDGHQTMVPPSKHPSGELVAWELNGTPAKVTATGLTAAVNALAEAVFDRLGVTEYVETLPPAAQCHGDVTIHSADPGTLYNAQATAETVGALLARHGWTLVERSREQDRWRRPGKNEGLSATVFPNGTFNNFSTNAGFPLEGSGPPWSFSPFAVYSILEHGGDYGAAAGALAAQGFCSPSTSNVDISGLLAGKPEFSNLENSPASPAADPPEHHDNLLLTDPGPLPKDLLDVPGFIGDVMRLSLGAAEHPNPLVSFAGALAMQAAVCGRKVRCGGAYPSIYLLVVGKSGCGKEQPRKTNSRIAMEAGWTDLLLRSIGSGAGLEDALIEHPSRLLQWDEFSSFLSQLQRGEQEKSRELLLTLFSAAGDSYTTRALAVGGNRERKRASSTINNPNLVLFCTATPVRTFENIDAGSLIDGLLARFLIIEASPRARWSRRSAGYDEALLARVVEIARWWRTFVPGGGLVELNEPPLNVPFTDCAAAVDAELESIASGAAEACDVAGNAAGHATWLRVREHANRLALLYACSRDHQAPVVDADAMRWASLLCQWIAKRTLVLVGTEVACTKSHGMLQKFLKLLATAPEHTLPHGQALRNSHLDAKTFRGVVETAVQAGYVVADLAGQKGGVSYRLVRL